MFFVLLRPIFCEKWKIAPPIRKEPPLTRLNLRNWEKNRPEYWRRPFFFFFYFYFWRSPNFGRKKRLNFGFRPKNHSEFWRRPSFFFFFFGDHLILGGKNEFWISAEKSLWILAKTFFFFFFFGDHLILGGKNLWNSNLSETFRLKFRTNRLKLIQGQWKFESRSFAHISLFQNSPPLFQILATRLAMLKACTTYLRQG